MSARRLPSPAAEDTCLITGASSGIGAAIARELASRGHGVTLVARSEGALRELATELAAGHGIRAEILCCDLADAKARESLPARLTELGLAVSVLVSNAGLGTAGRFVELETAGEIEQMRVMCEAAVELCGEFVPEMASRRSGAVLIVSSLSGLQPMPNTTTYAAAKGFLLYFGESLHAELRSCGVSVTTLCPGPVSSGFFARSGPHPVERIFPGMFWQTPEQVAGAAVDGLDKGRRIVIPGIAMRAAAPSRHLAPRAIQLRLLNRFFRAA